MNICYTLAYMLSTCLKYVDAGNGMKGMLVWLMLIYAYHNLRIPTCRCTPLDILISKGEH